MLLNNSRCCTRSTEGISTDHISVKLATANDKESVTALWICVDFMQAVGEQTTSDLAKSLLVEIQPIENLFNKFELTK